MRIRVFNAQPFQVSRVHGLWRVQFFDDLHPEENIADGMRHSSMLPPQPRKSRFAARSSKRKIVVDCQGVVLFNASSLPCNPYLPTHPLTISCLGSSKGRYADPQPSPRSTGSALHEVGQQAPPEALPLTPHKTRNQRCVRLSIAWNGHGVVHERHVV